MPYNLGTLMKTTTSEPMCRQLNCENGFITCFAEIPQEWVSCIIDQNFSQLDRYAGQALKEEGFLFQLIQQHALTYFSRMGHGFEYILSLRKGPQTLEDDGIWHDDGTRLLAFSLSLNLDPESIIGGHLSLRKKSHEQDIHTITARPLGTLTLFCTGQEGWEHKTNYVEKGSRLVLAGWLT